MPRSAHDSLELDELTLFADEVNRRFDSGQYKECLALISDRIVEAWFAYEPQNLVAMVQTVVATGGTDSEESGAMILNFMGSLGGPAFAMGAAQTGSFGGLSTKLVASLGRMVHFRQQGMVTEAFQVAVSLEKNNRRFPFFYDSKWGLRQLLDVQAGISAMLAGEFVSAIQYLTSAQLRRPLPTLPFLSRDAYVKSALVHALFGDLVEAQALLDRADEVPRTSSWAEASIDASAGIVRAVLAVEGADLGWKEITDIELQHVGEMWPFYTVALQRTYERHGERQELRKRLRLLEEIQFPRVEGEGFSGSVFPLAFATLNIADGHLKVAHEQLLLADQGYVGTQLLWLLYHLLRGRIDQVLEQAYLLRTRLVELRQMNVFCVSVQARAHLAMNDSGRALESLRMVAGLRGGLNLAEITLFPQEALDLAKRYVPEWPTAEGVVLGFFTDLPVLETILTERETAVLQLLGNGNSRQQIAAEMYVTVNTVKTHLTSIYRKLGVKNRREAIAEAAARGLL